MQYKVTQVYNRRTMKDFLDLPFKIYRNNENWVSPIKSEVKRILNFRDNPYFKNASLNLFNCYKNGEIISRVAVIINKLHYKKFNVKSAFIGFFESMNDTEAVKSIFKEVDVYCKNQNIDLIEGPFNPNHYSELGIQLNNYDKPPSFFQPYNPEYYLGLLQNVGYNISEKYYTLSNKNVSNYIKDRYGNIANHFSNSKEFTIRSFDFKDYISDLEKIREVFNDAFSGNWHFLPLSREEYIFSAKFLKYVTKPELIKIVEYKNEPVGVLQFVLDINPLLKKLNGKTGPIKLLKYKSGLKHIKRLIIYAVGIKKKYQSTKVFKLLLEAAIDTASKYDELETTWISDKNIMALRTAEYLGLKPDKEICIMRKILNKNI